MQWTPVQKLTHRRAIRNVLVRAELRTHQHSPAGTGVCLCVCLLLATAVLLFPVEGSLCSP